MKNKIAVICAMLLLAACQKNIDDLIPIAQFPTMILEDMDNSVVSHISELKTAIESGKNQSLEESFVNWKNLANALHSYEIYEAAELAYKNALKFEINQSKVKYQMGHLYRLQSKYEQSNSLFSDVINEIDDYPPVYNNLAENLFEEGKLESAKQSIEQSLHVKKDEPYALQIFSNILFQSNELELAKTQLEKALSIQPNATKLYFNLAQIQQQLGQVEQAEISRDKGGDLPIQTSDIWLSEVTENMKGFNQFITKAQQYINNRDYNTAKYWIKKAESDRPNGFTINMIKGLINVKQKDNKAALSFFKKAQKIRPNDFKVNLNLGTVSKLNGDYKRSAEFYKKALEIDSSHIVAQLNYADSNCSAGNLREAMQSVKILLESEFKEQVLLLGLKCQIQHKRYHAAHIWVKENISQIKNNSLFIEYAVLLLVASPIDSDRDGKLAMVWLEKLMKNNGTNKQRQLLVMALMEDKQFNQAQQVLSGLKNTKELFTSNQYLQQLINAQTPYRLSTY